MSSNSTCHQNTMLCYSYSSPTLTVINSHECANGLILYALLRSSDVDGMKWLTVVDSGVTLARSSMLTVLRQWSYGDRSGLFWLDQNVTTVFKKKPKHFLHNFNFPPACSLLFLYINFYCQPPLPLLLTHCYYIISSCPVACRGITLRSSETDFDMSNNTKNLKSHSNECTHSI